MEILNEDLLHYSEQHTTGESPLLKAINRDTHAKVMMPRMLSGHLQGRVLSMISKLIPPKINPGDRHLYRYSAICLRKVSHRWNVDNHRY
jgi:hypothetical protein